MWQRFLKEEDGVEAVGWLCVLAAATLILATILTVAGSIQDSADSAIDFINDEPDSELAGQVYFSQ